MTECVHYWKIEEPSGPVSKGVCKYCGREKEYVTAYGYRYNNKPKND